MQKYEYTVQELSTIGGPKANAKTSVSLTEFGDMGWELVAVVPLLQYHNESSLFIFKRPRN
jgi:hypothetical protein